MAGCVGAPLQLPAGNAVELTDTPFFPQRTHECGPAALATVLAAAGAAVTADELTEKVFLPGRRGSLQLELIGATRGYDRLAYIIEPRAQALFGLVQSGRPVLVLQNLGLRTVPRWHYAVVVGFDPTRETVILRSGTTQRLETSARRFMRSWALGEFWGMATLNPDELPAGAQPDRYLQAAAGLEAAARHTAALTAYHTALRAWPDDATALLGVGNVQYRQGELAAAEQSYRALLARHPAHAVGRNNLAQVLLEQGRAREALTEIQMARHALSDLNFEQELAHTEAQIREALRQSP